MANTTTFRAEWGLIAAKSFRAGFDGDEEESEDDFDVGDEEESEDDFDVGDDDEDDDDCFDDEDHF